MNLDEIHIVTSSVLIKDAIITTNLKMVTADNFSYNFSME